LTTGSQTKFLTTPLPDKPNLPFVVTSYPSAHDGGAAVRRLYCARGDMENRIKEQQLGLFADRTSTAAMRANQLRLWFAAVAYVLVNELRRMGLRGTALAAPKFQPSAAACLSSAPG
jgi:Transposase DDE domain group 1